MVCKKDLKWLTEGFNGCEKVFFIYVIVKDNVFTAGKERGTILFMDLVYKRGTFSVKNGILKGNGLYLRAGPPSIILCLVTPWDLYL